eukprot:SM000012S25420  [mRNA]  locus=s12:1069400:1069954:+ [translate_table: standard]
MSSGLSSMPGSRWPPVQDGMETCMVADAVEHNNPSWPSCHCVRHKWGCCSLASEVAKVSLCCLEMALADAKVQPGVRPARST